MTDTAPIHPDQIAALAARVDGTIVTPGDPGYDEAREVWNARFDRRPDLVLRPDSTADVVQGVTFARDHGLTLSVKGGGHDYAGNTVADGGLLLDLGGMSSVAVDRGRRRARVGSGATWKEVDRATQGHELATPGGTVSSVGVAGFTLGGGSGWLTRKHGLAVDNVRAAELVTASGEVVRASGEEHPELFWALRGGGGNFGVVTEFEYELHPLGPDVVAGQVIYTLDRAGELLRAYADYMKDAPDPVACYPFFIRIPPDPAFPEALHGEVVLDFVVAYMGPPEEGEAHLEPFRSWGEPALDTVGPAPYVELQQAFDPGMGKGNRWYSRFHHLGEVSDDFIDTLLAGLEPFPGPFTAVYLGALGGAVGRVPADRTAYPHRAAADFVHIFAGWTEAAEDDEIMAWARGLYGELSPYADEGPYVNMLSEDEEPRIPAAYGENYDRLRQLKERWDPENLFRGNHNIPPGG